MENKLLSPSPLPPLHPSQPEEDDEIEITRSSPPPTASISLSLSLPIAPLASRFVRPHFTFVKLPAQMPAAGRLHFPAASAVVTTTPLLSPAPTIRRGPTSPFPGGFAAGARRCAIVWFRSDLRVHDHEPLAAAAADSPSLLPVFLFDPRDYGRSPASGLHRTGPHRASFVLGAVADLRRSLRARGSDLIVRVGQPKSILPELARAAGACAVYAHREVARDEVAEEEEVEEAVGRDGVGVTWFWGSTLHHIDDLPFGVEDMPLNYAGFRERVKGLKVRDAITAPEEIKELPSQGDVEPGEIPTLLELGITPPPPAALQDGKSSMATEFVGGETEAMERLKSFATEWCVQAPNEKDDNSHGNIYGANFSCKISPWLTLGCLSPRFLVEELKETASRAISSVTTSNGGDETGDARMNWLVFELLWRDFFRFITRKYSSAKKSGAVMATACAGSLD